MGKLPTPQEMLEALKREGWTLQKISDTIDTSPATLCRAMHGSHAIAWDVYARLYTLYKTEVKNGL